MTRFLPIAVLLVVLLPSVTLADSSRVVPPTATALANSGQLLLSQQHIARGTTTLGVAVSQFRDGERVTVTWVRGDGAGAATLGEMGTNVAGSAATTVNLPVDAPPATYTVTATGNKGSAASAFVTVVAPGATAVPTAISYSPRLIVAPSFTHGISMTGGTSGNGDQLPIRVEGFPPHATLHITLQLLAHGQHAPIDGGAFGPTDAQGAAAGDVALPADLAPGAYDVEATAGAVKAGATVTIQAAASDNINALGVDVFAGLWSKTTQGLMQWWADFMQEGQGGVLAKVLGVVLYQDDPTLHTVPAIVGLMGTLTMIGQGAIEVLVAVRVLTITLGLLKRAQGWAPWLTLLLELTGVLVAVAALTPVEHAVWGWVQRFVTGTDTGALDPLLAAVKKATTVDTAHVANNLPGLGAIVLLIVLAGVFLVIELTRLGGFALLEVLYILGPFVVPLLLLTETRGVALTWFRSILAISVWPILYLLFIEGGVAIVFSFSGGDVAVFSNPLVKVGLGVMLVMALLMVPEMAGRLMSNLVAGAGSIVDARRTPALHFAGRAQARLRGLLPF